jgi:hypothetical protein
MFIISSIAALFALAIVVLLFVFWIWMLIDCIQNERLTQTEKIVWVLVVIFLHAFGALLYLLLGRKR